MREFSLWGSRIRSAVWALVAGRFLDSDRSLYYRFRSCRTPRTRGSQVPRPVSTFVAEGTRCSKCYASVVGRMPSRMKCTGRFEDGLAQRTNSTTSSSLDSNMERVHEMRHSCVMGRMHFYLAYQPNGGRVCRRFTLLATNSRLVNEWESPAELRQQASRQSSYGNTT